MTYRAKSIWRVSLAIIALAALILIAQSAIHSDAATVQTGISQAGASQARSDLSSDSSGLRSDLAERAGLLLTDSDPWTAGQVESPADLAKWLLANQKPVVLQVGFFPLYRLSHIPGSIYAGPANSAAGLDKLKAAARDLPRTKDVVLYCGCCPFGDCPNVRPAFSALKEMGFTKLKVLMLANNFTQDWVNKGYPAERVPQAHRVPG